MEKLIASFENDKDKMADFNRISKEEFLESYSYINKDSYDLTKSIIDKIKERLEYLRQEIEAERISYGEIAELEGLADHIDKGDVVLLEWAGVKECGCTYHDENDNCTNIPS